ncbi:MAG: endolytic transglycosylase MltG [Parcubacteria group bacterium]|jgi:UPF0755 protein
MRKLLTILIAFFVLLGVAYYYFSRQVYFSHGPGNITQTFELKRGEGVKEIASELEKAGLIKNKYYFDYYIWKNGSKSKIKAGEYELKGSLTIPEIVQVLSLGEIIPNEIKVTFPEGMNSKDMAEVLGQKGFKGDDFLSKLKCKCGINTDYDFLSQDARDANLEGFLFPDTYIFFKDATSQDIIDRMVLNFDEKITEKMKSDIENEGKSVYEVVTMASILEKEVRTPEDMKIASGIFWDRISAGMPLQSCATVAYVLGKEKKQYSFDDTRTPSPYNTYLNKGLPPSPIDNPGLNAIEAAIYPTKTDYTYFLTDPETGKTIFSKTIEEHEANKVKYGL